MDMSKILIDTNCYTSYLCGNHDVLDALADADMVLMSIFVLGEDGKLRMIEPDM